MDLVQILILTGFGIGNLVGIALWVYQNYYVILMTKWYKDFGFWMCLIMLILFGTAYLVISLILWFKEGRKLK